MTSIFSIILLLFQAPNVLQPHLGSYRGTIRNAAGVAQLGTAESVTTTVTLEQRRDSLFVRAINRSGTQQTIGAWPMGRVTVNEATIKATGVSQGPLHLRRDMTWTLSAGIRVNAELKLRGKAPADDDYFGGKVITLTLLKVR
jgi:hypothetical protein